MGYGRWVVNGLWLMIALSIKTIERLYYVLVLCMMYYVLLVIKTFFCSPPVILAHDIYCCTSKNYLFWDHIKNIIFDVF
jgi:hypothetical protein